MENTLEEKPLEEAPPEAIKLCAGRGKFFSRTKEPNSVYPTTSWRDIVWMASNPLNVPKESGWWFIPSSYCGYDARTIKAQVERGHFWLIVADLDKGNLPLSTVITGVGKLLDGGTEYLIYATKSSKPNDKRWRIVVPIGPPGCPGYIYHHLADQFNRHLGKQLGVEVDNCTSRQNQIAFCPNKGTHYEKFHCPGVPFGEADETTLAVRLVKLAIQGASAEASDTRSPKARGYYLSEFARRYPTEDLLERYGFVTNGRSWHHPKIQTSGSYSTDVKPDGTWLTGSESLYEYIGRRGGDSFDLYVAFECRDREQAYRNICAHLTRGNGPPVGPQWGDLITCGGKTIRIGTGQ